MANPTKKHTSGRTRRRRGGQLKKLVMYDLVPCSKCGEPKKQHYICNSCGTYDDKQIIDVAAKIEKREKKRKARLQEQNQMGKPLDAKELSKKSDEAKEEKAEETKKEKKK